MTGLGEEPELRLFGIEGSIQEETNLRNRGDDWNDPERNE